MEHFKGTKATTKGQEAIAFNASVKYIRASASSQFVMGKVTLYFTQCVEWRKCRQPYHWSNFRPPCLSLLSYQQFSVVTSVVPFLDQSLEPCFELTGQSKTFGECNSQKPCKNTRLVLALKFTLNKNRNPMLFINLFTLREISCLACGASCYYI